MKIAFAGKGGVGKTTLCAWLGDYLARQGQDVVLVDADTALSLGQACGLSADSLPVPLIEREDLIRQRIGRDGYLSLNPDVSDLPDDLCVDLPVSGSADIAGRKRLLTMGSITGAGDGCACGANALLKSLLAHLIMQDRHHVLVDLEAGVEHLGRGTVANVDSLIVVSEPGRRSLDTAVRVSALAADLGLSNQVLAVNRGYDPLPDLHDIPGLEGLPEHIIGIPVMPGLVRQQLRDGCVLDLDEADRVDSFCKRILASLDMQAARTAA